MKELGIITIKGCLKDFAEEQSAGGTIKHLWFQDPITTDEFSAIIVSKTPEKNCTWEYKDKDGNTKTATHGAIWKYEEAGENKIAVSPSILMHDILREDKTISREGFHCGIPTYFELISWEELQEIVWGKNIKEPEDN